MLKKTTVEWTRFWGLLTAKVDKKRLLKNANDCQKKKLLSRFWGLMTAKKKKTTMWCPHTCLYSIFKKLLCGVLIPDYVCVRIQVKMLRSNGCTRMLTYADVC